ncbi:tetratricopeptide repeat protein [Mariprofundus sp. KV]|uniref:O-linked N-acetylglucosamine transferase family protein n=1 Tax=Mariprofundus sp. KV TaxID=2608715 RepID=UPI0015A14EB4
MTGIADAIEMYNQGRFQEVEQICSAISSESESYAQAQHLLGLLAYQHGMLAEAEVFLLNAIALRPREAMFRNHLGSVQCALGRLDDGIATYRRAIKLNPRLADTHFNLGNALKRKGEFLKAQRAMKRALELNPDLDGAKLNLAILLRDQGQTEKAEKLLERAMQQHPDHVSIASNYLFNLNYHITDGQRLFDAHLKFAETHAVKTGLSPTSYVNIPDKNRRLRIGYVSADLYRHSVAYFFEPLLRQHQRDNFEIFCYSSVIKTDDITERLQGFTDVWRDVSQLPDRSVAEQVRQDGIDILVDLGGHTSIQRLLVFAEKPAPIQVTYLGYPNTTGLSSIDYRFTDIKADPAGNERWHAERLLRLPGGFLCFSALNEAPDVEMAPNNAKGYITFGCFNAMAKIQPELIQLWSEILKAVPDSRLLLKNTALSDKEVQKQLLLAFRKHGVGANRLMLHGRLASPQDHLSLYHQVDIALDSFPYNGTTTSFEALWMGVPLVSLYGDLHASRVGLSILSSIGLEDLTASTPEQYVTVAKVLADDRQRLEDLRLSLRDLVEQKLCDAESFTCRVEDAFRKIWQEWCEKQNRD